MTSPAMNITQLEALIERVNAATGPDRELDRAIGKHFGITETTFPQYDPDGVMPRYTASIGAALALVDRAFGPEKPTMLYNYELGWHASAHAHMAYTADLHLAVGDPPDMQSAHGQAHTQPAAILAALIAALIKEPTQ